MQIPPAPPLPGVHHRCCRFEKGGELGSDALADVASERQQGPKDNGRSGSHSSSWRVARNAGVVQTALATKERRSGLSTGSRGKRAERYGRSSCGTIRHANADLPAAACGDVRHEPVEAEAREQRGHDAAAACKAGEQTIARQHIGKLLVHRIDLQDRKGRIDVAQRLSHERRDGSRLHRRANDNAQDLQAGQRLPVAVREVGTAPLRLKTWPVVSNWRPCSALSNAPQLRCAPGTDFSALFTRGVVLAWRGASHSGGRASLLRAVLSTGDPTAHD